MTEYIPTDTDMSEIGDYQDDYNCLLAKCGVLSTENEILKKQLKDEIFERDNRIQHLIFENERLKNSLESANNLLTFFQSQDNSKYKKINEQLSTKNFDLEQTNHFLKRENFSLKSEMDEIKIELEKLKALKATQNSDYSLYSTYQGSRGLETEGNCDLYNYVNTETLNSNSVGAFGAEGRGSLLRASSGYAREIPSQQGKANDDLNALGKANSQENPRGNKSGSTVNINFNNNINCNNNNEEKYMVDEKLTENDFCFPNNDAENINNNLNNNNNNNYIDNNNNQNPEILNNNNNCNNNLEDSCDSSSEDIRNMNSEELKAFIKKVKKESKDFYKKALDMLTENEFEIMKLKSEIEHLKETSVANSTTELKERNSSSSSQQQPKSSHRRRSLAGDAVNESLDVQALLEELDVLKRESLEKQNDLESEKNVLEYRLSQLDINHKLIISDYENEIYKLKYEIENLEIERNILEKDINKENHERSNFAENLEHYNEIIRNLEEQKDKSENNNRNLVENLMSEKKKMEKIILDNMEIIHKLESEVKSLKESEAKAIKDISDDFKREKQSFERELIEVRGNNGVLTKERELLKKELEATKASYKNAKVQISDLSIENAKLKEAKNDEVKRLTVKLEENLEEINTKFHQEKLGLQEKIKELLSVIDEKGIDFQERESLTLQNIEVQRNTSNRSSLKENEAGRASERKDSSSLISSFNFEALNKEIENMKSKNFKLQVEINTLNNKLKVKENKIANTIRLKTEIDVLKKEKTKYKADMLELKKLYEEQINELLEKLNSSNEINKQNSNSDNKIGENSNKNDSKEAHDNGNCNNNRETFEELNETILKLNYEKRFLQDQVNILTKELENMEKLKNEYIKKLKEDLEQTEDIAACAKISLAQMSFEKETEIVKYKKYYKKLKLKIQAMQTGTPLLHSETLSGASSPDKSRFNNFNNNSAKKSLSDFSLANNLISNNANTGSVSARVNTSDYGTNVVGDSSKKSFFDKLFNK